MEQPAPYRYHNSAFSTRPGEAWSGNLEDMQRDMKAVLDKGEYGKVSRAQGVAGFSNLLRQSVALRPLQLTGKNGETVYALDYTSFGPVTTPSPYEAIQTLFNSKYHSYAVEQ